MLFRQLDRPDGVAVIGRTCGQLLATMDQQQKAEEVLWQSAQAYRSLGRPDDAEEIEGMALSVRG